MSEFDDYVINEKNNLAESSAQNALRYGYNVGDMVWGKVKSHPWWPGHIFNEAFASSTVRKSRRDGSVLVAFFGDSSYGWFDPELIPFETNFAEKSKQTTSRAFTKAVEEAVDEAGGGEVLVWLVNAGILIIFDQQALRVTLRLIYLIMSLAQSIQLIRSPKLENVSILLKLFLS
ncbi:hypothetical protein MLD38_040554 [Melastoma candidum]|nr:hypothetical protein MLD38_040554 [Melastoma candidum]